MYNEYKRDILFRMKKYSFTSNAQDFLIQKKSNEKKM